MRRSALTVDQGPSAEEQSSGRFPSELRKTSDELPDPDNVPFSILRRMRRDHAYAMALHFIAMSIVRAPWFVSCNSARVSSLVDNAVRPIWGQLVNTILRFLWAGFSPAAKRFEVVRPGWTYIEDGQVRKTWDEGTVGLLTFKPVVPLKPELCRPIWKSGNFDGIRYDSRYSLLDVEVGAFIIDGQRRNRIDLTHSVWAAHGMEGEDNVIFGFPRLAHGVQIYHSYWYLWEHLMRAFENNADPSPVVRYPTFGGDIIDADGNTVRAVDTALNIGRRRRTGSTTALPSDPYTDFADRPGAIPKWGIEYPESRTDFDAMMEHLGWLEALKFISVWLPAESMTGSGVTGSTSNRNTVGDLSDQRDESQDVLLKQIIALIEIIFVKPFLAMNVPSFEGTVSIQALSLSKGDDDVMRQVFQLIGQQDWRQFGIDVRQLAEARGFPMLDQAEQQRILAQAIQQQAQQPPPPVTPTQGRRALVTQTGFGEHTYVQLGGRVELPEDDSFVLSLGIEDKAAAGLARLLYRIARDREQQVQSRRVADSQWSPDAAFVLESVESLGAALQAIAGRAHRQQSLVLGQASELEEDAWAGEAAVSLTEAMLSGHDDLSGLVAGEARRTFSYGRLQAARGADRHTCQRLSDGVFLSVEQALDDVPEAVRITEDVEIVRAPLEDGLLARYDEEAGTVLLSPDIEPEDERRYVLALGERLSI